MKSTLTRAVRVERTARLIQFAGKFDLDSGSGKSLETVRTWDVDVALPDEWSVGVVVGPSMAGKTSIVNELFPGELVEQGHWPWPTDKFIGDGFPEVMTTGDIAGLLSSVGFSSPPEWLKPYAALSNGGKFRVDLARTIAERVACATAGSPRRAVMDEFGSLIHADARTIAAAAAAKAVRRLNGQLVALCVHEDAVSYFDPDWIIDIRPGQPVRLSVVRGLVRRPPIELRIERTTAAAWEHFRHHHYLNHGLHKAAACFVGYVGDQPAAFTAVLSFPHPKKPAWREHRTVCLPDFQGVGIGNAMSELVASLYAATGKRYISTTSHPAMIRHRVKSKLWRCTRKPSLMGAHSGGSDTGMKATSATMRITAGFEYVGSPRKDDALRFGLAVP